MLYRDLQIPTFQYLLTCRKEMPHARVSKRLDIVAPFQMRCFRMVVSGVFSDGNVCRRFRAVVVDHSRFQVGIDAGLEEIIFSDAGKDFRHRETIADQRQGKLEGIAVAALSH